MSEKTFENKVKDFLKSQGCWVLKTWSNGVQRKGVPDLLVCCNGYFVGVELKAENGKPSDLQLWNIDKIRKSGGIAIVLYPDQFEEFKRLVKFLNELPRLTWNEIFLNEQIPRGVNVVKINERW